MTYFKDNKVRIRETAEYLVLCAGTTVITAQRSISTLLWKEDFCYVDKQAKDAAD